MDRGNHRAMRVQHQRHPGSGEFPTFARQLAGELLRQLPVDLRKVHAGLLEDAALAQQTRPPAAALRPLPSILAEPAPAIELLKRGSNALLQGSKVERRLNEKWIIHHGHRPQKVW